MSVTQNVLCLLFPIPHYKSMERASGVKKDMCKSCFQTCSLNIHVKI